jgi:malate dehydrogenase (oxaloacetate-decarboxylating)
MSDVYEQSVELHKKFKGKLEVTSKVPLNSREDLSLAYTPGVARVCEEIAKNKSLARDLTFKGNSVAVVTDGSAILGLGNLGPEAALPVMEGKAVLFKAFANVDAVPICLATQDTEEIIQAVKMIAPTFGGINLEDISAPRCFEIEERLKKELDIPVMHDDQHGTATVVLAALINSLKLRGTDKGEIKIVINGAGAAGVAVTELLIKFGVKNVIVCDSKGIISSGRTDINETKKRLLKTTNLENREGVLIDALKGADVFIGVSAKDVLKAEMIKEMNSKPIIFGLANPIPEIMPDIAKEAGAYIVATGRSDFPNQINNVLAFPGIFRGALDNQVKQITDEMLIKAAESLAAYVKEPSVENILPQPLDKNVAKIVAEAIK